MDGNQKGCTNCGAPMPAGTTFCAACGNRAQAAAGTAQTPVAGNTAAPTVTSPTQAAAPSAFVNSYSGLTQQAQPATPAQQPTAVGTSAPVSAPPAPSYSAAAQQPAATVGSPAPQSYSAPVQQPAAPVAPASAQPNQNYGAPVQQPAATPNAYGQAPVAATGYGQQQPASPYGVPAQPNVAAPAYGQTAQPGVSPYGAQQQPSAYGQPQGNAYPGAQPGFPVAPPPKKKSPVVPIIIVLLVLVIAGVAAFFVIQSQKQKALQAEYDAIVTSISDASSPSGVVSKAKQLDKFTDANPKFAVHEDLKTLIEVCRDYEDGDMEDEAHYANTASALKDLEDSDYEPVSDCVGNLIASVESDYAAYQESLTPPTPDPDSSTGGGDDENYAYTGLDIDQSTVEFAVDDDNSNHYSFVMENNSGKTIVYFEVWFFCYDSSGNPVVGKDGTSWEWAGTGSSITLEPGQSFSPDDGYFPLSNVGMASMGYAYINYVEYSDGSIAGATLLRGNGTKTAAIKVLAEIVKITLADPYIATKAAGATFTLPANTAHVATFAGKKGRKF